MIKVPEMTNKQLDEWVPRARGWILGKAFWGNDNIESWHSDGKLKYTKDHYHPSTDDGQAGELIGEFLLSVGATVHSNPERLWESLQLTTPASMIQYGNTWNQAVCRAVIAGVLGEEVKG